MRRRKQNILSTILATCFLLGGCATVNISPKVAGSDFSSRASALHEELQECSESTSYLCTDRAVCSAQFPRVDEPVRVSFGGRIAGFQTFAVVVEPEGYVSEIHRFKKGTWAADKMSITTCTANLAVGSL